MARCTILAVVAVGLLGGCGRSDYYSVMPDMLKQPKPDPRPPEPEPEVARLLRGNLNTIFTDSSRPRNVSFSKPRRDPKGNTWIFCLRADVSSATGKPVGSRTYKVDIDQGHLGFRRPAEPGDGCESESYQRL